MKDELVKGEASFVKRWVAGGMRKLVEGGGC
jgi:hypothetical protein